MKFAERLSQDLLEAQYVTATREMKDRSGKRERHVILDPGIIFGRGGTPMQRLYDVFTGLRKRPITPDKDMIGNLVQLYMRCGLKKHEIESEDSLMEEFGRSGDISTHGAVFVRGWNTIVASLHATLDARNKRDRAAFIKFGAADPSERGRGLMQELELHVLRPMGHLQTLAMEAVDQSENHWGRLTLDDVNHFEAGTFGPAMSVNGARRIYAVIEPANPEPSEIESRQESRLVEVKYKAAGLHPDDSGRDPNGPFLEHFMMAQRGYTDPRNVQLPKKYPVRAITRASEVWYQLDPNNPPENMSPVAVENRNDEVLGVLDETLRSIPQEAAYCVQMSKGVRLYMRNVMGYIIVDHDV